MQKLIHFHKSIFTFSIISSHFIIYFLYSSLLRKCWQTSINWTQNLIKCDAIWKGGRTISYSYGHRIRPIDLEVLTAVQHKYTQVSCQPPNSHAGSSLAIGWETSNQGQCTCMTALADWVLASRAKSEESSYFPAQFSKWHVTGNDHFCIYNLATWQTCI